MKKSVVLIFFISFQFAFTQWEPLIDGLGDVTVNSLYSDDGALLAGTDGAIFRSTNNGESWENVLTTGRRINDFFKYGDRLLAATKGGVYASTDGGLSWIAKTDQKISFYSFTTIKNVIYAPTGYDGIFLSKDGGETWKTDSAISHSSFIARLFAVGDNLIGGSSDGIIRSTDGGKNWTLAVKHNNEFEDYYDFEFSNGSIFIGIDYGYLVSRDSGATWTQKQILNPQMGVRQFVTKGQELFAFTREWIFRSKDTGRTWTPINKEFKELATTAIFDGDNVLIGAYNGGIFKSTDNGATWASKQVGLSGITVNSIEANDNAMIINSNHIYTSSDQGQKWIKSSGLPYSASSITEFKNNFYACVPYAEQGYYGVYISTDNGMNWSMSNQGIEPDMVYFVGASEDYIYASGGNDFYRSQDGKNWIKTNYSNPLRSLSVHNGIIYTCLQGNYGGVAISFDKGNSWLTNINYDDPLLLNSLDAYNSIIFGATDIGVFFSADSGKYWNLCPSNAVRNKKIRFIKSYSNYIFAGAVDGLYFSNDAGQKWNSISGNLGQIDFKTIKVVGDYVYVGTANLGLCRAKLSDLGILGVNDPVVENKLRLFPNPAGDYLNISTGNSAHSGAILQVFDMLGNEALSISPNDSEQIKIDIRALPAGTYYIRYGDIGRTFMKY